MAAFLMAILLGVAIGAHDSYILTTDLHDYWVPISIVLIVGLIGYVTFLQYYTWQIAFLICYTGLVLRPVGFDFGPMEMTCGLGFVLALLTGWQRLPQQRTGILQTGSFKLFRGLLLLSILYMSIHLIYNIYYPFKPAEFALKNALKTYFASLAPVLLLWYFSAHPASIRIKGNFMRTLGILLLVGIAFNLAITGYGILTHHNTADPDSVDHMPTFFIPLLNARENPYMLRTLGPAAILLGATTLSLGSRATEVPKILSFLLILLGSIGTVLSGGRAAVTTSVVLVLATLLLIKRFRAFWSILFLTGFLILFVNVFSDWINRKAPIPILRPLQWVMVSKNTIASESIESSSRWRQELFQMAIEEWRSDPRIFWFGRATYGFGVNDFVAYQISGGYKAAMEASLRRGATHNLLSDLLVTYGLVGCIIYYCLILGIIRFLSSIYGSPNVSSGVRSLALFCLITYASYLLIATVAGGLFLPELIWLLVLLIAALHHYSATQPSTDKSAVPTVGVSRALMHN
jgi:hypothetical protein